MNAWVRASTAGKSLYAIAVLLALTLRILVPTGFMPTLSSHTIVVALCSDMSGKTVIIDIGKKSTGAEGHSALESPCAFAAGLGTGLAIAADFATIQPFIYGVTIVVGSAIADLTLSRLAAPPPPSQGPPALS